MNLGETIYKLRTERNLSQEELANMLEVSRQSVSKWETNGSIPDLDKLIKLSEIFGVTIDEMIKGERVEVAKKDTKDTSAKQSSWLWWGWATYTLIVMYWNYRGDSSWMYIFKTIEFLQDGRSFYIEAVMEAWFLFISLVILSIFTIRILGQKSFENTSKHRRLLVAGWSSWLMFIIVSSLFKKWYLAHLLDFGTLRILSRISIFQEWVIVIGFEVVAVYTCRYMRTRKSIPKFQK